MPTVTFQSILKGVYQLNGGDPDQLSAADTRALIQFIADRTRDAWEYYRWPEQMLTEERFFRNAYANATAYAEGDEVYYEGAYYVALGSTTGNLPTDTTYWEEMSDFRKWIPWEQTGETEIEAVLQVWDSDPHTYADALPVPYKLMADGITIDPSYEETSVWVEFRSRCPNFEAQIYSATASYAAGDIVYWDTDVYLVASTTTAGQTPESNPDKFTIQSIPYRLARAIKAGVLADWLTNDDQDSKAAKWDAKFTEALEEQVWQLTKLQGQTGRPTVSV